MPWQIGATDSAYAAPREIRLRACESTDTRVEGVEGMPKLPIVERRYVVAFALTSTCSSPGAWRPNSTICCCIISSRRWTSPELHASLTQFAFYIGYFCARCAVP